jgi:hypothetical protein
MEGAPRWGGSPGRYSMFRNGWVSVVSVVTQLKAQRESLDEPGRELRCNGSFDYALPFASRKTSLRSR